MSPLSTRVRYTLHEYGPRSGVHGVSHWNNAHGKLFKTFWFLATIMGSVMCTFHVYYSICEYMESPIASKLLIGNSRVVFPDITFCNTKPVSESIYEDYKHKFHQHLRSNWSFFDEWRPEDRMRRPDDTNADFEWRLRLLFVKYFEIMYVSDDVKDFGMSDETFVRHCMFGGKPCSPEHFVLVQHYKYWNCFTYKPPNRNILGMGTKQGLHLIAFTDSYIKDTAMDAEIKYTRSKTREQETSDPYTLESFIETTSINHVIKGLNVDSPGMKVFIHNENDFSYLSSLSFDISNGVHSILEFSQFDNEFEDTKLNPCNKEEPDTVQYVTAFGANSTHIYTRNYSLTERETLVELIQDIFYKNCKCYSHRFPFQKDTSRLCYFVPPEFWKTPSQEVITRIGCHDNVYSNTLEDTVKLEYKARLARPCKHRTYTVAKSDSKWPDEDDIVNFMNAFIIPQLEFGQEFNSSADPHYHHILGNMSSNDISNTAESAVLRSLINQDCDKAKINETIRDFWCSSVQRISKNLIYLWVKPESIVANSYREEITYKWPEVLSEIGGTLGLWLGMSLLTFFELFELFFLCYFRDPNKQRNKQEESKNSAELEKFTVDNL